MHEFRSGRQVSCTLSRQTSKFLASSVFPPAAASEDRREAEPCATHGPGPARLWGRRGGRAGEGPPGDLQQKLQATRSTAPAAQPPPRRASPDTHPRGWHDGGSGGGNPARSATVRKEKTTIPDVLCAEAQTRLAAREVRLSQGGRPPGRAPENCGLAEASGTPKLGARLGSGLGCRQIPAGPAPPSFRGLSVLAPPPWELGLFSNWPSRPSLGP
ncbi:unnamed protein product [Rangifer tarandus platyrhynchus]|uniref:Uncharacterized protein n=1 Tax=Rangifer tarandus platyrhynchus TaxID=3082113 RepID=A0AC59YVG6_RANTA